MRRSQEKITTSDLKKLLRLAQSDIDHFFERNPEYKKLYEGKEVLIALCQGAALHYIDGENGVKDFDVWFFYPKFSKQLPYRRRGKVDFGKSKFGKSVDDVDFIGRRIDILIRSDLCFKANKPAESIVKYLNSAKSATSKHLSHKAVIGLYPNSVFGKVLWPKNLYIKIKH